MSSNLCRDLTILLALGDFGLDILLVEQRHLTSKETTDWPAGLCDGLALSDIIDVIDV